jgi:DNA-binding LacI/PurR family transcriptional regulator
MTVRLKDVAQDLGLSAVTVSKVLRDHPDISEETFGEARMAAIRVETGSIRRVERSY